MTDLTAYPALVLMDILRLFEKLFSIRAATYNRLSICIEKFCPTIRGKLTWFSNNQRESFLTLAATALPSRVRTFKLAGLLGCPNPQPLNSHVTEGAVCRAVIPRVCRPSWGNSSKRSGSPYAPLTYLTALSMRSGRPLSQRSVSGPKFRFHTGI